MYGWNVAKMNGWMAGWTNAHLPDKGTQNLDMKFGNQYFHESVIDYPTFISFRV